MKHERGITRRDFGRGAVMIVAGSTAVSGLPFANDAVAPQNQAGNVSEATQAEVEAKMQHVLARWGNRLNDEQKTRIRSTIGRHVRMLEAVRTYPLENGDCPASVLKLSENRSVPAAAASGPGKNQR